MAKNTEVAVIDTNANLPAHLQNQGKKVSLGNIDRDDLIIPRVKLLQAISNEVTEFDNAKAGNFWHTIAGEMLGNSLRVTPIVIRKGYTLWAPRGDDRGILARANDGINWDIQEDFEVKLKGIKQPVVWSTKAGTVAASGLARFGSSIPDDPQSKPAASLTYNILFYLLDHPEISPVVVINTRSAVKPAKNLISKIEMSRFNHYDRVFKMGITQEQGAEGPYFNYTYVADGYTTGDEHEITEALHAKYGDVEFKTNDDEDSVGEDAGKGGPVNQKMSSKF
jgi:hypothetical protein